MTDMRKGQYRLLSMALTALLLAAMFFVGRGAAAYVAGSGIKAGKEREKLLVVIDAGHGGDDPGKVGINGVYEKDLNLQIAGLVKLFLEANDVEVVMTRDSDQGLYDADASNKKVQDMKRRIALIDEAEPALEL